MAFFTKIFSKLMSSGGDTSVVGIDIGSSAVKIVELRKKGGRAVLSTYGALALGPYANSSVGQVTKLPNEKVAEALRDILREANATTKTCSFAIPLSASLLSLIEMPVLDQKQLPQMVPIEARKYIPVPMSDVTLDWWIIPKTEREVTSSPDDPVAKIQKAKLVDILLVVIQNAVLNNYREIVRLTGLDVSFFEIEAFSTIRAVMNRETMPVMIFDMGAGATKLYIVEMGIVRTSHTINRGSQDITAALAQSLGINVAEAEKLKRDNGLITEGKTGIAEAAAIILGYIFAEVNRVLISYQRKSGKVVRRVILTGGGSTLKGILPFAQENLESEVELADPFAKVDAPAFLQGVLKDAGPQFTVALGIALRQLQELG